MEPLFQISLRKVGGMTFLKVGRLTLSWSVSREYRPFGADAAAKAEAAEARKAIRRHRADRAFWRGYDVAARRYYASVAKHGWPEERV